MLHECIGERRAAGAAVIEVEWREGYQEIGKVVVMPECPLKFDDPGDPAGPFIVTEAPLSTNCENDGVSIESTAMNTVVAADKERVQGIGPVPSEGLATLIRAKTRRQRPLFR